MIPPADIRALAGITPSANHIIRQEPLAKAVPLKASDPDHNTLQETIDPDFHSRPCDQLIFTIGAEIDIDAGVSSMVLPPH
jgi:hypothetical protein